MTGQAMTAFQWPVRVYYEDTDSGGVVYYANYLRFMERARTEWLRSLGFEQDELIENQGVIFAVRSAQVDYLSPARFNDQLLVTSRVLKVGKASLSIAQQILKENKTICDAVIKIASLDAVTFRPVILPTELYKIVSK